MTTVIYLHGLASGPLSVKARRFQDLFHGLGLSVLLPDLNQPEFETLTVSRALGQTLDLMEGIAPEKDPVVLMGSSFGGLVAALAAGRSPRLVAGLVLMAPAFDMERLWSGQLGPDGLETWKRSGSIPIDHPAYGQEKLLSYGFYEDARKLGTMPPRVEAPGLVFHGEHDKVVDVAVARRFAELNPQVILRVLDDEHDLLGSVSIMEEGVRAFLVDHDLAIS